VLNRGVLSEMTTFYYDADRKKVNFRQVFVLQVIMCRLCLYTCAAEKKKIAPYIATCHRKISQCLSNIVKECKIGSSCFFLL
jgi:hypothetical protein